MECIIQILIFESLKIIMEFRKKTDNGMGDEHFEALVQTKVAMPLIYLIKMKINSFLKGKGIYENCSDKLLKSLMKTITDIVIEQLVKTGDVPTDLQQCERLALEGKNLILKSYFDYLNFQKFLTNFHELLQ